MPPKCKLIYFHAMGLAEPIRYLLAYGKVEFEDCRVDYEHFLKIKPTMPVGQLPVVEFEGKTLFQSIAISRFFAKKFNLLGKTDEHQLSCDIVVDTITDYRLHFKDVHFCDDPVLKSQKRERLIIETTPFYLSRFETLVNTNGGFFVGAQLTWSDLYFAAILCFMESLLQRNLLDGYPTLESLRTKVNNLDGVKEWIASRPKTDL
ncbi:glutathione S-transferase-like [Ischnura elegans]|uniref:glutathione S-transferase-like n=1 Tax=Ischnura elegans TaxID=197161 RepID=UPI001ED87185|nr:glutathione S-transferase-like [Ischnura elegans]